MCLSLIEYLFCFFIHVSVCIKFDRIFKSTTCDYDINDNKNRNSDACVSYT